MSTHCSSRTAPAQTGTREAPRSVSDSAASSRSPRSGSRDTDARRTASAQGRASPVETSSASIRTSLSTRARWTSVAFGAEVRARPVSCLPSAPRSRCSRLSGSGLSRESQEVTGQPVARPARIRVERSTASTTVGTPAAWARASSSASTRSSDSVPGAPGAAGRVEPAGRGLEVRLEPGPGHLLGRDPSRDLRAELGDAGAVAGADGEHRHLAEPVGDEQAAYVVEHRPAPVLRDRVDVVEHDQHHALVGRVRREVAVVDRGVGVLLRVEHPDQQVGQLDQAVHLEVVRHLGRVVVGQVEQHHPVEGVVAAAAVVEHRVAGGLVARRDPEPVEQLVGTLAPPDAGRGPRGGRAADADGGELEAGERVERGGLARAGGTGDRDDRVVGGEPEPAGGAVDDRPGVVDQRVVEPSAGGLGRARRGRRCGHRCRCRG